jgi:DNA-binding NtrC family response regulator
MTEVAAQTDLMLVSQDRGTRHEALVRLLGKLRYRVDVAPPAALGCAAAEARPCLVYLGESGWKPEAMDALESAAGTGLVAHLVAIDQAAFQWAERLINRFSDFVTWPCAQSELKLRLERSCAAAAPRPELDPVRLEKCAPVTALGLIGQSPAFLGSLLTLRRYAQCDAAVLIAGETGTGKELAARAIHKLHRRSDGPFVPVSCGALPDSLVESELFGHVRGAFTDARESTEGLVAQAQGGTLFLDEVEALSPKGQAALLRFLEGHEFRPVGGSRSRIADLRVIAAGNEDFHGLVRRGLFRRDLLYRLNVLSLGLPPLRRRTGDAMLLAEQFVAAFAREYDTGPLAIGQASRHWLVGYDWPGNVRELENLVHRAVVTASGPTIELIPSEGALPGVADKTDSTAHPFGEAKRHVVEQFERDYLTDLMRTHGGNVTRAAEQAGKERRALGKLLKKHGIEPCAFHEDEALSQSSIRAR